MNQRIKQLAAALISFIIVAFGQPAWDGLTVPWGFWLGILSAAVGFAIFIRLLLDYPKARTRFLLASVWFMAIQLVQLSWFISHPYSYIYGVYVILSALLGMQFGVVGLLITRDRLNRLSSVLAIAGVWTLFEWSRLFYFSGYTFNPIGLALAGNLITLQTASLAGIYGLSFWVLLTNLLAVQVFEYPKKLRKILAWSAAVILPYLLGGYLYQERSIGFDQEQKKLNILAVQTDFSVDDLEKGVDKRNTISHVTTQWNRILETIKTHQGKPIDLIVLPEYVVLCGTYTPVFSEHLAWKAFGEHFGENVLKKMPNSQNEFLGKTFNAIDGSSKRFVNNAYWSQSLANVMNAAVLIGLEDVEDVAGEGRQFFSSAQYFIPNEKNGPIGRYDKRVLLPLGEYIPFKWCQRMAASYGVCGSFTPGLKAKVFEAAGQPFGISICYEETFGDLMRENKQLGAKALVNLTSDAWYPNSRLVLQHLHLARLRTVENGISLIRSANIGVTGAWDSLGRSVGTCGDPQQPFEFKHDAICVDLPLYTYSTLYSQWGDHFIVTLSGLFVAWGYLMQRRKEHN